MADRVNNNVWGPLSEAVEQVGERAKELNVHARDLARAAVSEIRDRAVSLASDRAEPVLNAVRATANEAREAVAERVDEAREALVERVGDAREALSERVGGIEFGQLAEQVGKRLDGVRARVAPFEGMLRGRVETALKGLNLAIHSDVAELEKRLAEADKRLARLERQVAEVRRAA